MPDHLAASARPLRPLRSSARRLALIPILALAAVFTGCTTPLPQQVDRPLSAALSTPEETALGHLISQAKPATAKPGASAFALLDGPQTAYGSRLALVDGAQKTLDLQYYAIHADQSTAKLLRDIVKAAKRGVRVRVLLDDFHSTGPDAQVMRLAFVPNIEMRMFNPLAGSRSSSLGRAWTILTDFQRAQQRMHNKLFVADNVLAVIGGRNLGDAYFDAAQDDNFVDLDVLSGGAIVQDLSRSFDNYWNNVRAYPVQSLISEKELLQLKTRFDQEDKAQDSTAIAEQENSEPGSSIWDEQAMDLKKVPWTWAQATVLVDSPAKIPAETDEPATKESTKGALQVAPTPAVAADSVVEGLLTLIRTARKDLLIVSPYFVPGPEMMSVFRSVRQRGVRIRLLTNSLASNDAPLAHAGYARYRKELLEMGVELHELRSEAADMRSALRGGSMGSSGSSTGKSRAMLHSKLLVIDGRLVVVGSMNLDLRSQLQNTEIALLIASRSFSRQATDSIDESLPENSWRVEIGPDGGLIWRAPQDSGLADVRTEPDASLPLRLMLQLLGPLAPDRLL